MERLYSNQVEFPDLASYLQLKEDNLVVSPIGHTGNYFWVNMFRMYMI